MGSSVRLVRLAGLYRCGHVARDKRGLYLRPRFKRARSRHALRLVRGLGRWLDDGRAGSCELRYGRCSNIGWRFSAGPCFRPICRRFRQSHRGLVSGCARVRSERSRVGVGVCRRFASGSSVRTDLDGGRSRCGACQPVRPGVPVGVSGWRARYRWRHSVHACVRSVRAGLAVRSAARFGKPAGAGVRSHLGRFRGGLRRSRAAGSGLRSRRAGCRAGPSRRDAVGSILLDHRAGVFARRVERVASRPSIRTGGDGVAVR